MVRDDPETAAVLQPLRNLCEYRRDSILRDSLDKSALENATVTNNDYLGRIAKHYFTITHINTMLAVYSSRRLKFIICYNSRQNTGKTRKSTSRQDRKTFAPSSYLLFFYELLIGRKPPFLEGIVILLKGQL